MLDAPRIARKLEGLKQLNNIPMGRFVVLDFETTVTRSRLPRAFTRMTAKPVSALWKVTRSTVHARVSRGVGAGAG